MGFLGSRVPSIHGIGPRSLGHELDLTKIGSLGALGFGALGFWGFRVLGLWVWDLGFRGLGFMFLRLTQGLRLSTAFCTESTLGLGFRV